MDLKVDNDTLMVRFKDYGFFVPKEGVEGKTAIISGEIFYDTLSVELLRHTLKMLENPQMKLI